MSLRPEATVSVGLRHEPALVVFQCILLRGLKHRKYCLWGNEENPSRGKNNNQAFLFPATAGSSGGELRGMPQVVNLWGDAATVPLWGEAGQGERVVMPSAFCPLH